MLSCLVGITRSTLTKLLLLVPWSLLRDAHGIRELGLPRICYTFRQKSTIKTSHCGGHTMPTAHYPISIERLELVFLAQTNVN